MIGRPPLRLHTMSTGMQAAPPSDGLAAQAASFKARLQARPPLVVLASPQLGRRRCGTHRGARCTRCCRARWRAA